MALRIPAQTEENIVSLYTSGLTFEQVAAKVGHDVGTVHRAFKRLGGTSRARNVTRRGIKNGRWKGGIRIANGYAHVWIPDDHKFAAYKTSANSIAQHRLVMMEHLDRPLQPYETVHHKNGVKLDNRIENLQLLLGPHGNGKSLCCADCGSNNLVAREIQ